MFDNPGKGLTCCTPRPNVPASYICTTNVGREVTNHRAETLMVKGSSCRVALMGGAPSQITAPLRARTTVRAYKGA